MSNQNFILILSGIIGVISGLAAVILKQGVHAIQNFLTEGIDFTKSNCLKATNYSFTSVSKATNT